MCDHRVVRHRCVVREWDNPSGSAEVTWLNAAARLLRAERAVQGDVLSVWQVLHGTLSVPLISAHRVARFDDHFTLNLSINKRLCQRYSRYKPRPDGFRISVKRERGTKANTPDGYVSNLLHDQMDIGTTVELGPPCGAFFLDITEKHERPLVLLAAGVGITPILSILLSALEATPDREMILIHGCLNEKVQAFKPTIDALAANHANLKTHYRYSAPAKFGVRRQGNCSTGFVDAALMESMVPDRNADYYFCGPKPFMVGIYHELLAWGIPGTQVHFEFFGPRQELEAKRVKAA